MSDSSDWFEFAEKIYVDPFEVSDISITNINPMLKKCLNDNGIEVVYSLQKNVINHILKPKHQNLYHRTNDICISSPTGSGKTLCFIIPILNYIYENGSSTSIIVTASKILCHQISVILLKLTNSLKIGIKTTPEPLKSHHRIYVLTPFKLNILLTKQIVQDVNFLIFDEADVVFKQGQQIWQRNCLKYFEQQNVHSINDLFRCKKPFTSRMFLSASLTDHPEFIATMKMIKPTLFCTNTKSVHHMSLHKNLKEIIIQCDEDIKHQLLTFMIQHFFIKNDKKVALVFVNSVQMVEMVGDHLRKSYGSKVGQLHSGLMSYVKERVIEKLQKGKINVLVATDALTRGLDVITIEMIINYEKPENVQTYLHRIGRTCRGFKKGTAVTLVNESHISTFEQMIDGLQRYQPIQKLKFKNESQEDFENVYNNVILS